MSECVCSRHSLAEARREASEATWGFGSRRLIPLCTEPDEPNNPDCTAFWRYVAERGD